MKITFLGVSGALDSGGGSYNSNMLIDTDNGKTLLVDAGSDIPHSLDAAGRSPAEIDGVYISHLHADHAGGLEWLGYLTYFHPEFRKLPLYIHPELRGPLWENSLKAGMGVADKPEMQLTDYFDIPMLSSDPENFTVGNLSFGMIQLPHITHDTANMCSYGLMVKSPKSKVFITTDTSGQYNDLTNLAVTAQMITSDLILHDCSIGFKSSVHAFYDDLNAMIPAVVKEKMWLYHYSSKTKRPYAVADGFAGFVETGQVFEL